MTSILDSNLLSTKDASALSGYNADYLSRLCRSGKISGTQIGRTWLINRESLQQFVREQEERKQQIATELSQSREKEYQQAQKKIPAHKKTMSKEAKPVLSPFTSLVRKPATALVLSMLIMATSAYAATFGPVANVMQNAGALASAAQQTLTGSANANEPRLRIASNVQARAAVPAPAAQSARPLAPNVDGLAIAKQLARVDVPDARAETDGFRILAYDDAASTAASLQTSRAQTERAFGRFIASDEPISARIIDGVVGFGFVERDIVATVLDSYSISLNRVGETSLALAAGTRDAVTRSPEISAALLDTYSKAMYGWVDGSQKLASRTADAEMATGPVTLALVDGTQQQAHAFALAAQSAIDAPLGTTHRAATIALASAPHALPLPQDLITAEATTAPTEIVASAVTFSPFDGATLVHQGGQIALATYSWIHSFADGIRDAYGAALAYFKGTSNLAVVPLPPAVTISGDAMRDAQYGQAPAFDTGTTYTGTTHITKITNYITGSSSAGITKAMLDQAIDAATRSLSGNSGGTIVQNTTSSGFSGGALNATTGDFTGDVNVGGNFTLGGTLASSGAISAPFFTATSLAATSTFPNIISNSFSIGGDTITDFSGSGLAVVNGVLTATASTSNAFQQGGNTFGATATIGTTDNNALSFITNNLERMAIDAAGNVTIGTTTSASLLSIGGDARADTFTAVGTGSSTLPRIITRALALGNDYVTGFTGNGLAIIGGVLGLDANNNYFSTTSSNFWFGTKSTADLAEGANKYFTDARADARINATSTIGTLTSAPNLGTVATTLSGILKATSGVLSSAVAGTDYLAPSSLSATYPLTYNNVTGVFATAFGTTTANTFNALNTFNGGVAIGTLNGPLQANNGVVSATSSIGVLYGGTGLTVAPTYGQILVGNASNGYTLTATSSLGLESALTFSAPLSRTGNTISIPQANGSTNGFLASGDFTLFNNKISSTSLSGSAGISYNSSTGAIANTGLLSLAQSFGSAQTGAITFATTSATVNGQTFGLNITNSSGAFTFTPSVSGTLTVAGGGTGSTTLTGLLKGNGTGSILTAVAGTDYQTPITATYPIQFASNVLSLAFGTTTANSWSALQTFNGGASTTQISAATGFFNSILATSTTATSSFSGGLSVGGTGLNVLQNGKVGIGNSSPAATLDVTGTLRVSSSITLSTVTSCIGSQALQTNASGDISCGTIATGGASSGGGWTTNNTGVVALSTTTDQVVVGASTTPYAKFTILSGSTATTTLALFPASGQTANILDIYNTNGALSTVIKASGFLGLGTTSPSQQLSVQGSGLFSGNISTAGLTATGTVTFSSLGNGLVKSTAGVLSIASAGTDYLAPSSLSAVYPLQYNSATGVFLTAFGTTTANTFSALNTFNGGVTIGSLNGVLHGTSGVVSASNVLLGSEVSGMLPVANGGTGWAAIASGAIPYGNGSGALSTTSAGTNGQTLALVGGVPTWVATTTFSSGLSYSAGNVTNTGLLSLAQTSGSAQTGAITFATSSATTNGQTIGLNITNSAGTFTFTPSISGTLTVAGGGTGSTTLTGILKGNGTGSILTALAGTDYEVPLTFSTGLNRVGNTITNTGVLAVGPTGQTTTGTAIFATSTTGTDFTITGSGATITFNLPTASASNRGALSSADWALFNNKISSTSLSGGAGISYNSSTGAIANTGLLSLAQSSGSAQTGAITFATSSVTNNGVTIGLNITNSSGAFTFTPTRSGTLTVAGGGTGLTTVADGSLLFGSGGTTLSTLATSTSGKILQLDFTTGRPSWVSTSTLGLITAAIQSIGPAGQLQTGPTVTYATSTSATTGLTAGITITGSGNTITYAPTLSGTLNVANGGTGSTTLSGILKGNGTGSVLTAIAGTDYEVPLTFSAPLSRISNTISIPAANGSTNGYLASADWTLFNNKISSTSLSATYPLTYNSATGVFATAFGTTTANTFSALNTFNGGISASTIVTSGSITTGSQFLGFSSDGASAPSFSWTGDTSTGIFHAAANIIGFTTAGVERARIDSNGFLGIGTSTPYQALSVVGTTTSTGGFDVDSNQNLLSYQGSTTISILGTRNFYAGLSANGSTTKANGTDNVFIGNSAGYAVTASQSVYIGAFSGFGSTTGAPNSGSGNTAVGYQTLKVNSNGSNNSAFGKTALAFNTTGGNNSAFGLSALQSNTTGNANTAIGAFALGINDTGSNNIAIGSSALLGNDVGNNNAAIGNNALFSTSGNDDIALGTQAGYLTSSGSQNVFLGGQPNSSGTGYITTGSNNIGIGYNTLFPNATTNNQLNIGNFIFGTLPATTSASSFVLPTSGKLGVGTSSPYAKLSIQTNNGDTAKTLFAIGSSTASATTTLFSIDNTGVIVSNASATSTFANGLAITAGCVSVGGTCLTNNAGTVTSVNASGGTTGLSFSGGPITTSGSLTLAGTLTVANGGTGSTTLSGLLKGNGTGAVLTAVAGTDYEVPLTFSTGLNRTTNTITNTGVLAVGPTGQTTNGTAIFATSTTGTDFTITGSGATITFNLPSASASNRGLLTSADWATFNNKISSTSLSGGAGISYNSSTGAIANTGLLSLAQSSGSAQTGAITFATSSATTNGQTIGLNITNSTGTFTFTPTLSGTLTVAGGGTGITSVADGALLYGNSATTLSTLATSTGGKILQLDFATGRPSWVATSTLGLITAAIQSIGPAGQLQTGPAVTYATSTSATTGLTAGLTITGSGNVITYAPTLSGTLNVANGGTGSTTLAGLLKGNGTGGILTAVAGTDYQAPLTATYPVQIASNVISLAFGTTTANSWSALQTFNGGVSASTINTTGSITAGTQFLGLSSDGVGAPSFSWTGDTSTGIYHGGSNIIGFTTSGIERARIDSSGFFGIGTSTPAQMLSVTGNTYLNGTATVQSNDAAAFTVGLNGPTNPAFTIDDSTGSSVTGLRIKSAAAAGGLAIDVTSSGTNENLTINAKGTGRVSIGTSSIGGVTIGSASASTIVNSAASLLLQTAGVTRLSIGDATANFAPATRSSTASPFFKVTGTTGSSLTASTDAPLVQFLLTSTQTHATGALDIQRDFFITPATHAFVGASTLASSTALAINGVPINGTNATVTNAYGIFVNNLSAITTGTTNAYGLTVLAPVGATNNYAATFLNGSVGIGTTTPGSLLSIGGNGTGWNFYDNATTTKSGVGGINIAAGCFAVNGTCVGTNAGTVTSVDASGGTTGLSFSGGPITSSGSLTLAGTLGIANGGTNATSQVTNGVNYFDGTRITSNANFTFNGTNGQLSIPTNGWLATGGNLFAYASSTNGATIFGIGAGGQNATTSATVKQTTAIGYQALSALTSGSGNTALGYQALTGTTIGGSNSALGWIALTANISGARNSAFGAGALATATSTSDTVAVGYLALSSLISSATSGGNTAIGDLALSNATYGGSNTAIGSNALLLTTTGSSNTAVGASVLGALTSGGSNVALGSSAGSALSTASFNTLLGSSAGSATNGNYNTFVGYQSGSAATSGYGNTLLGASPNASNLTTGFGNIGIGYNTFFPSASGNNQLVIGGLLYGTLPATTTAFTLPTSGALGIGTSSPYAKLSIQSNNGDTATTLFAIGSSTASATSTLFSIDNTGILTSNASATSTFLSGLNVAALNITGSATSTAANGFNITNGCYAVNGTCLTNSTPFVNTLANGGTATTTFYAGGVVYSDGSKLTQATGSGASIFLWDNTNGFLSIGTTTPYRALSVVGTTTSTGGFNVDSNQNLLSYQGSTTISILGTRNFYAGLGANGSTTKTSGSENVFIGNSAGYAVTGVQSVYIGALSGFGSTTGAANSGTNTAVGYQTLKVNSTGSSNDAFGKNVLSANTTGNANDGFGSSVLLNNTTGSNNQAFGNGALGSNKTGNNNAGIGFSVFNSNVSGNENSGIGSLAGGAVTTGSQNLFLGVQSNASGAGYITTGSNNIGIGYNVRFPSATASNQLNIGNFLFGTIPATTSASAFILPTSGALGIGTSSPYAKLSIQTNNGDTATTLFAIGSSTAAATTTLFTIDNTGILTSNASATSTFLSGLNVAALNITGSATSTAANGFNITNGCYAVNGTCLTNSTPFVNTLANGGTATTTFFNGGVVYSDGTKLTQASGFTFGGTNGQLSVPSNGGYDIGGNLFAYASTTNGATLLGIGAGGTIATTTGTLAETTAIGFKALSALNSATFGRLNTAVGYMALSATTNSTSNTAIGAEALKGLLNSSGQNTAIGTAALSNLQFGNDNIAIGVSALGNSTGGDFNVAIGDSASVLNNAGENTVAIGYNAAGGLDFFTASGYTVLGYEAGGSMSTSSDYNTLIGYASGDAITTGYGNTLLGANADIVGNLTTGGNNIGIGYNTIFPSATASNQLNIGNFLFGTLPATTTTLKLPTTGALGIGTTSPFAKFSIGTNNGDTAKTLFAIGSSTASATTTLFSIDNTGILTSNASATSTFLSGLNVAALNVTGSATSTAANGINITNGCFAVNGVCVSAGTPFSNTLAGGGTATTTFYNGGVVFSDGSKLTQATGSGASIFAWDNTNGFLGIGTTTPYQALSVVGTTTSTGGFNVDTNRNLLSYQGSTTISILGTRNFYAGLSANGSTTKANGTDNVFIGNGAGYAVTSSNAVYIGSLSGFGSTTGAANSGASNTAVGYLTLRSNTTGGNNSAFGAQALNGNDTASGNSAFGVLALASSTSGGFNSAFGLQALEFNTTGVDNTAVGVAALTALTTGNENVALGRRAGNLITTGSQNVLLGKIANAAGTGYLTTGSNNIGIGYNTLFPSATASNQLNIGNFIFGTIPATTSASSFVLPTSGKLGIGTSSAYAKLSVQTNNGDTATTLFAIGSSTASATTTLFSIDNTGILTSNASATSTFLSGLNVAALNVTGSATSTAANGINITNGCFAVNGTCVGGSSFTNTLANGGTATTTFYAGGLVYSDGSKLTQATGSGNSILNWNNTNGQLGLGTSTPWAQLSINPNGIGAGPSFVIGSSTATNFIVTNAGLVGIGKTAPTVALDVTGAITSSGTITSGANFSTGSGGVFAASGFFSVPNAGGNANVLILKNNNNGTTNSSVQTSWVSANSSASAIDVVEEVANNDIITAGAEYSSFLTRTYVNGTLAERTRIGYNGSFGIGSSTPWGVLSVNPTSNSTSSPQFVVGSSTGTAFIVANNSRIGIGTSTPGSLLSVQGIANFSTATSTFSSTGGINLTAGCFAVNGTCIGAGGTTYTGTYPVQVTGSVISLAFGTTTANAWSGLQEFNANASSTQLTVTGNTYLASAGGSVGIGTTSPYATLSVQGVAGAGGTNAPTALAIVGGTGGASGHSLAGNGGNFLLKTGNGGVSSIDGTGGVGGSFELYAGNGGNGAASAVNGNGGTIYIAPGAAGAGAGAAAIAGNLILGMNSTGTAIGNVGIATSTPGSLLSIGGVANFTTATSTFYGTGGINLTSGCFAVNGSCVGAGSFSNTLANGGTATTTFYSGGVVFSDGSKLTQAPNSGTNKFFWNNTNGLLGIGTNAPTAMFTLQGTTTNAADISFLTTDSTGAYTAKIGNTGNLTLAGGISTQTSIAAGSYFLSQFGGGHAMYLLNSADEYGQLQNDSSDTWSLSHSAVGAGNLGIPVLTWNNLNKVGIGSTTPFAKFSIQANAVDTNGTLFAIGSSTAAATTTLFSIDNTGILTSNASATSTFLSGLNVAALNVTGSATSTAANGINITNGCFAVNGVCVSAGTPFSNTLAGGGTATTTFFNGGVVYSDGTKLTQATGFTYGATNGQLSIPTNGWLATGGNLFAYASSTGVTILGLNAGGQSATTTGGSGNITAIGTNALAANTVGGQNTAVGNSALLRNTTGSSNSAVGTFTLQNNINGLDNNAFGYFALSSNTSGNDNTGLGQYALTSNSTGNDNTGLGNLSGYAINSGSQNIMLGAQPNFGGTGYISTGSNNIGLGYNTRFPSATANNQLNIGNFLFGTLPATTSASTFILPTSGALGVGTSSPYAKLSIQSNNGDTATTLFAIGSSTNAATTTLFSISNTGILTSNASATSTFLSGLNVAALNITGSATSTAANGLNITAGCYAVNGTCISAGGGSFSNTLANGGTATTTFYANGLVFSDGSKLTQATGSGASILNWDNTNGFLGIGTSTPAWALSIQGTSGAHIKTTTDRLSAFAIENSVGSTTFQADTLDASDNIFSVSTSTGANYFLIDASGHVGIGTSTPTSLYSGVLATGGPVFVGGASTTATSTIEGNLLVLGTLKVGANSTYISENGINTTGLGGAASFDLKTPVGNALSVSYTGFSTTTLLGLNINGSATSTSNVGFNLTGGCYGINGICTSSIAGGGTGTTTGGVTNGVEYYNGTTLTNSANLTFNGTNFGIGSSTPGSLLSIGGNGTGWNFYDNATTTKSGIGGINIASGCFAVNGTCLAGTFSNSQAGGGTGTTTFYAGGIVFSDGTRLTQSPNSATNAFKWDNTNGFLGIGSSTPWGQLSVNPNGIGTGPEFVIGSTTSTHFIVTNSGKVGISSTSPSQALSIIGNSYLTGTATVQSNSATAFTVGANGPTNPVLTVVANTASVVNGLSITGGISGGTLALAVTDSGSNSSLTINGKGTGTIGLGTVSTGAITIGNTSAGAATVNGSSVVLKAATISTATIGQSSFAITPTTRTSVVTPFFSLTGTTGTTLTASTDAPLVNFLLTSTQTHAAGAQGIQRDFFITPATHAYASASTLSSSTALAINGAPINGTNATVTNAYGIFVNNLSALTSGTTNAYGLTVLAPAGATNNYSATFLNGNVGVGTTSPASTLTVNGGVTLHGLATGAGAGAVCATADGLISYNSAAACTTSSQRFKNSINPIAPEDALNTILKLQPVTFRYNQGQGDNGNNLWEGFIAEQVDTVDKSLVQYDPSGDGLPYSVYYQNITSKLTGAVQALAGRTNDLSISTTTLGSRVDDIQTALAAQQAAPVNTASVNTQSLTVNGNAFATAFIAPATPITFTIGSTTGTLPNEILTDNGTVDLYKAATYAITGMQSLQAQTDILASRLDAVALRVTMLEAIASSTPATSGTLSLAGLEDLLSQIGIMVKDGIAHFTSLAFTNLIAAPASDGTSAVATSTIAMGDTQAVVVNNLAHPSSKIFVTITSPLTGSWYISQKSEGSFTINLSSPQTSEVTFDYFIVQTEGNTQVASAGAAPAQVSAGITPPADPNASSTPAAPANAPTITLSGSAAVDIAQGAFWADPGATAQDAAGNDLTAQIVVTGSVDTNTAGVYTLNYSIVDSAGASAGVSRIVHVGAPTLSAPADPSPAPVTPPTPPDSSTPAPVISDAPAPPTGG